MKKSYLISLAAIMTVLSSDIYAQRQPAGGRGATAARSGGTSRGAARSGGTGRGAARSGGTGRGGRAAGGGVGVKAEDSEANELSKILEEERAAAKEKLEVETLKKRLGELEAEFKAEEAKKKQRIDKIAELEDKMTALGLDMKERQTARLNKQLEEAEKAAEDAEAAKKKAGETAQLVLERDCKNDNGYVDELTNLCIKCKDDEEPTGAGEDRKCAQTPEAKAAKECLEDGGIVWRAGMTWQTANADTKIPPGIGLLGRVKPLANSNNIAVGTCVPCKTGHVAKAGASKCEPTAEWAEKVAGDEKKAAEAAEANAALLGKNVAWGQAFAPIQTSVVGKSGTFTINLPPGNYTYELAGGGGGGGGSKKSGSCVDGRWGGAGEKKTGSFKVMEAQDGAPIIIHVGIGGGGGSPDNGGGAGGGSSIDMTSVAGNVIQAGAGGGGGGPGGANGATAGNGQGGGAGKFGGEGCKKNQSGSSGGNGWVRFGRTNL